MDKISTGNLDLDQFFDGGYERDVITTFYGPAGSGKTNLCMLAAVSMAKTGKKVIFMDTEGGFSVDRLKQLTDESVLKNILLLKATSFDEQQELFNKLLEKIKPELGLIIVDSMAMLYRLELALAREKENQKRISEINGSLSRQLRILAEIARKKFIPVIVTNQVYSDFSKNGNLDERAVHMVGGDLLKHASKCIVELKIERDRRKAILRKHRSIPQKEFLFYITGKGISKAGFRLF